jgi:hypothetical protein
LLEPSMPAKRTTVAGVEAGSPTQAAGGADLYDERPPV